MMELHLTDFPENVLPLPQLKNHSLRPEDGAIRTKMASGHLRIRRRFVNPATRMTVRWLLSGRQYEIFNGWYVHVLRGGVSGFRMRVKTGMRFDRCDCKFSKTPSAKAVSGDLWEVSTEIQIKQLPVMTLDETLSAIHGGESITKATHDSVDAALTEYVTPDN